MKDPSWLQDTTSSLYWILLRQPSVLMNRMNSLYFRHPCTLREMSDGSVSPHWDGATQHEAHGGGLSGSAGAHTPSKTAPFSNTRLTRERFSVNNVAAGIRHLSATLIPNTREEVCCVFGIKMTRMWISALADSIMENKNVTIFSRLRVPCARRETADSIAELLAVKKFHHTKCDHWKFFSTEKA